MAKTYNTLSTVSAGSVLTATAYNEAVENSNNYRVPPHVMVSRSSDLTSYAQGTNITWNNEVADTDAMWSSGTTITINTAGIYVLNAYVSLTATATLSTLSLRFVTTGTHPITRSVTAAESSTQGYAQNTTVVGLAAATTIDVRAIIGGGSNYTIKGAASGDSMSYFSATWIGQTS